MCKLLGNEEKIEKIRKKLHQLIREKEGNLLDPEVVETSQKLDIFLAIHSEISRS